MNTLLLATWLHFSLAVCITSPTVLVPACVCSQTLYDYYIYIYIWYLPHITIITILAVMTLDTMFKCLTIGICAYTSSARAVHPKPRTSLASGREKSWNGDVYTISYHIHTRYLWYHMIWYIYIILPGIWYDISYHVFFVILIRLYHINIYNISQFVIWYRPLNEYQVPRTSAVV